MFQMTQSQELTESIRLARLVLSRQLLKRYQEHDVAFTRFTDEKIFTVAATSNSQNDRVYAALDMLKKQIAAKRLLRTQNTFSQSIMISLGVCQLGCTELFFVDPSTKINGAYYRDVLLRHKLLPAIRRVSGKNFIFQQDSVPHIVRVKLWRFCVEKHQTSFFQICGLQTVQISIQLITRSGLSCSIVFTRGKSTPSTN